MKSRSRPAFRLSSASLRRAACGVLALVAAAAFSGCETTAVVGNNPPPAPSDARQGEVLANIVKEQGIDTVAVTYTNNDYGKGLADSFSAAFQALGGTIAISAAHEDKRQRIFRPDRLTRKLRLRAR